MSKGAARKKPTTIRDDQSHVIRQAAAMQATSMFWANTIGMGWRLAITVLVPLIGGVKLDQHFNTSPSYTLTGFIIAIAGASVIVWNTVKEVNAFTPETTPRTDTKPAAPKTAKKVAAQVPAKDQDEEE